MASEIGRGQTEGSNTFGVRTAQGIVECELNGVGKPIIEGENPVSEAEDIRLYPEYHRTRETRWEDGGTTLQA